MEGQVERIGESVRITIPVQLANELAMWMGTATQFKLERLGIKANRVKHSRALYCNLTDAIESPNPPRVEE